MPEKLHCIQTYSLASCKIIFLLWCHLILHFFFFFGFSSGLPSYPKPPFYLLSCTTERKTLSKVFSHSSSTHFILKGMKFPTQWLFMISLSILLILLSFSFLRKWWEGEKLVASTLLPVLLISFIGKPMITLDHLEGVKKTQQSWPHVRKVSTHLLVAGEKKQE